MTRTGAAILMLVGAGLTGHSVHNYSTRYSSANIWNRQKDIINMSRKNEIEKGAQFDTLRQELKKLDGATDEKRCRFEKNFEAVVVTGSGQAAEELIKKRSFEPYSECKDEERAKASVYWFTVAGAIAFIVGAVSMATSFFRKKE